MTRNPLNQLDNRNDVRFLITTADIKKWCPVSANIPDSEFFPSMATCQDIYIKDVLGNDLFNKLWSEWVLSNYNPDNIRDNTQTPDGVNYKELYQYVNKALLWWSFVKALTSLQLKVDTVGIVSKQADFTANEGYVGLNRLIQEYTPTATYYQDKLICYVRDTFKPLSFPDEGNRFPAQFFFRNKPCKNCNNCKQCK